MNVIVYMRPDGGVSICRPAENERQVAVAQAGERADTHPVPFWAVLREAGLLNLPFEEAVAKLHPVWAETEDEFVARILAKDVPDDASQVRTVDESSIPADRTFRDAWSHDLRVDMEKAREIHRDRMRAARAPLLQMLDVEYQRADEVGDPVRKRKVTHRKQLLRDVTADPRIAAAETPSQLKAVWPAALTG